MATFSGDKTEHFDELAFVVHRDESTMIICWTAAIDSTEPHDCYVRISTVAAVTQLVPVFSHFGDLSTDAVADAVKADSSLRGLRLALQVA